MFSIWKVLMKTMEKEHLQEHDHLKEISKVLELDHFRAH